MNGREAVKIESLIPAYPNGLTVIAAELATARDKKTGEPKEFCRVVFKEEPSKFANGGSALTKIVKKWFTDGGFEDAETLSKELEASGGVKVKMSKIYLPDGNPYTVVDVVDK